MTHPKGNSPTKTGHPILELIEDDRHIRVYADGVVEGPNPLRIVNHLPLAIRPECFDYFRSSQAAELPYDKPKACSSPANGAGHSTAPHSARMSEHIDSAAGEK